MDFLEIDSYTVLHMGPEHTDETSRPHNVERSEVINKTGLQDHQFKVLTNELKGLIQIPYKIQIPVPLRPGSKGKGLGGL